MEPRDFYIDSSVVYSPSVRPKCEDTHCQEYISRRCSLPVLLLRCSAYYFCPKSLAGVSQCVCRFRLFAALVACGRHALLTLSRELYTFSLDSCNVYILTITGPRFSVGLADGERPVVAGTARAVLLSPSSVSQLVCALASKAT